MFFQKKLDRALKWLKDRNAYQGQEQADEEQPSADELRQESKQLQLEKGDLPALIISAMLTFIPICLIILLVLSSLFFLLFL